MNTHFSISLLVLAALCPLISTADDKVVLNDGDRIVFVGATFIERDVQFSCIETVMTTHFSNKNLTFRNLGWSGDNVFGIARASFDPIPKGYERLVQAVNDAEPDVILISYGQNESFKGKAGLREFIDGYNKLLDDIADTKGRVVMISPTLQENMGPPLPDPAAHNADIRLYTDAISEIAKKRKYHFIDMTKALPTPTSVTEAPRTNNGLHFTENSYWEIATVLMRGLGYNPAIPDPARLDAIREVIKEKNRLFFLKWRPQNETYITGFRKHEQGQHVAEIPMFDPLILEEEKKIADLRTSFSAQGEAR